MADLAWGDKGMKKRRETKETERHKRGPTKKKAIKESSNGETKKPTKKKGA